MKVHTFHIKISPFDAHTVKTWRLLTAIIFLFYMHPLFCQPPTPTFKAFQPISSSSSQNYNANPAFNRNFDPLLPNGPHMQQNARAMQQAAANVAQTNANQQRQLTPDVYASDDRRAEMEYMRELKARQYQNSFEQLLGNGCR